MFSRFSGFNGNYYITSRRAFLTVEFKVWNLSKSVKRGVRFFKEKTDFRLAIWLINAANTSGSESYINIDK